MVRNLSRGLVHDGGRAGRFGRLSRLIVFTGALIAVLLGITAVPASASTTLPSGGGDWTTVASRRVHPDPLHYARYCNEKVAARQWDPTHVKIKNWVWCNFPTDYLAIEAADSGPNWNPADVFKQCYTNGACTVVKIAPDPSGLNKFYVAVRLDEVNALRSTQLWAGGTFLA